MKRRGLGSSDLSLTSIGLGTSAIGGGDWMFGWGPQKDGDSIATVRLALEEGINWIDTAAAYGLGHAEVVVARALRDVPRSQRPYVFTTCGLVWDDLGNVSQCFTPRSIRREVEASLRRLETDCIDLYQLGFPPSPNTPSDSEAGSLEEAWHTMATLRTEGKAWYIGVSNCDVDRLEHLQRIAPVDSFQAPYSLMRRTLEEQTFTFCSRERIGVIASSSIESGLLTGRMTTDVVGALPHNDWRRRSPCFQQPTLGRAGALVERLRAIGSHRSRTPGQVAIAWALHNPGVTAASVGLRQPHQVSEACEAASLLLSANEIEALEHDPD